MKIDRILVPTDFSATARKAVDQALFLAARFDAELVVLHARVMYEDDPARLIKKMDQLKRDEQEKEKQLLSKLQKGTEAHPHLNIKHEVVRGYSAQSAILDFLKNNPVNLVAVGTHGRSGLGQFLIGSVAEKIVRYATCPVLTISAEANVSDQFSRITVPFDFSEHAKIALRTTLELAQPTNSEIDLVYVVDKDVHPALYAWGMRSIFEIVPDIVDKATRRMDEVLAEIGNPGNVKVHKHVFEGQPHKEIAGFINKNNPDLVVISTHGLVGLDRFLLGSTTEQLIRSVRQPILTIKLKKEVKG